MAAGAPSTRTKSVVCVDFENSPALKSLFSSKEIGESCKFTVEATMIDKGTSGATLALKKIITDQSYGLEEDKEIEPNDEEPVLLAMKRKRVESSKGGKPSVMPTARPTENSLGFTSYA